MTGISYAVIAPLMLFWATVGMALFYLAYRYNVLYVTETAVDTRGLIYPRALKQLMTGVYLAEICMTGLCAVSQAFWPLILMVVFLIGTVLFHITVQSALDPLLYDLPRSLIAEEESLMHHEAAVADGTADSAALSQLANGAKRPEPRKGNFFTKFFMPWRFASYRHFRKLVPHQKFDFDNLYEATEEDSYHPPSVTDAPPLLWIPEDAASISKQEVALTERVCPITDAGCTLDDNNKIVWDTEGAMPPIWEEKTLY